MISTADHWAWCRRCRPAPKRAGACRTDRRGTVPAAALPAAPSTRPCPRLRPGSARARSGRVTGQRARQVQGDTARRPSCGRRTPLLSQRGNPCWGTSRPVAAATWVLVVVSQQTRPRVYPSGGGLVGTLAARRGSGYGAAPVGGRRELDLPRRRPRTAGGWNRSPTSAAVATSRSVKSRSAARCCRRGSGRRSRPWGSSVRVTASIGRRTHWVRQSVARRPNTPLVRRVGLFYRPARRSWVQLTVALDFH